MSELLGSNSGTWDSRAIALGATVSLTAEPLPTADARVGKCYNNVLAALRQKGGQALYGWALTDLGPHRANGGQTPAPLYRRWLNHVVWRDPQGKVWEVSPNAVIDDHRHSQFLPTEFIPESNATFEIISEDEWYTRPSRYVPVRPEGIAVTQFLTKAQLAPTDQERNSWLSEALNALSAHGFTPREWKVEMIGRRTGSIWLIAE
jgi:hypothetical protein